MRAIDGDALMEIYTDRMEKLGAYYGPFSSECGVLSGAMKLLCMQPTIAPERETGKWLIDGHHIKCNKRGEYMCRKDYEGEVIPRKFCPNCGAKMEGLHETD